MKVKIRFTEPHIDLAKAMVSDRLEIRVAKIKGTAQWAGVRLVKLDTNHLAFSTHWFSETDTGWQVGTPKDAMRMAQVVLSTLRLISDYRKAGAKSHQDNLGGR